MGEITYLTEETFDKGVAENPPVLVEFTATWCGPCKALEPVLHELADDPELGFRIVKVDIDQTPKVTKRFEIRGVPTMLLFENGEILADVSGARTNQSIRAAVGPLL